MSESKKELFDRALMRCLTQLENFDECKSIEFLVCDGLNSSDFVVWESRNVPCKLPEDFKHFYSLFNGFSVSWTSRLGEKSIVVGELSLNKIQEISKIPLEGIFISSSWKGRTIISPDPRNSVAFIINSCLSGDVVFLLKRIPAENENYANINSRNSGSIAEIWLVDLSYRWHFICNTFSDYLRLLVLHLGIIDWQLAYTPEGLPNETLNWMNIFCKERLCVDMFHHNDLKQNKISGKHISDQT